MKVKTRYNIDNINKEGATINIIHGKRSGGKSYQAKHKKGINKFFDGENPRYYSSYKDKDKVFEEILEKGTRFILLRRFKDEISTSNIEEYFNDVDIMKITDNRCDSVVAFRGRIYLAKINEETLKPVKHECIGYYRALSQEQVSAGISLLDVTDIIFEEFVSRTMYLTEKEPDKLMNFYSTIDRGRGKVKLWLLGNSITRICPYFYKWGLSDLIKNMKKGDIRTKWLPTGEIDEDGIAIEVKLAIEYCENTSGTNYAIGDNADMINKGDWQTDPQPHLPKSKKSYDIEFRIGFLFNTYKFIGELLVDRKTYDLVWFIYPYEKEFSDDIIVISNVIKTSPLWQRDIYDITLNNKKVHDILRDTFHESMIFYSSDLCGTDFKQVIDFTIRK